MSTAVTIPSGIISRLPWATGSTPRTAPGSSVDAVRLSALEETLAPAPIATLTWDDGQRFAVYGRSLFGRNPAAEDGADSVILRDETLSLSKTHFEIGGDTAAAWIVDRYSTNGTILVREGVAAPLAPGSRVAMRPGDRLEFGDRHATVGAPA